MPANIQPVASIAVASSTGYALMHDGASILLEDGLHSLPSGELARPVSIQGAPAAVDPSGARAVSLLQEKLLLWDLASGGQVGEFAGSLNEPVQAQFSPSGSTLVSAGDRFARIWDVASLRTAFKLKKHETQTTRARFSPDGSQVISIAEGGSQVRTWNASDGNPIHVMQMPVHEGNAPWMDTPHDVVWSTDGTRVIAGSSALCVFDAASGALLAEIGAEGGHYSALAAHPDGRSLIVTVFFMDGDQVSSIALRSVDLSSGTAAAELPVEAASNLAVSPDGSLLVAEAISTVEIYSLS
ncbi:MAG: hypothetical protein JW909_09610 [Planctomycetes bacterium]|nr:hypothetical protein [Planctomycetota bacterium]